MRPVLVDGRPLQSDSGSRGIGTYLRGLLEGMAEIGVSRRLALLLTRGEGEPLEAGRLGLETGARLPRLERRAQVLADPALIAMALRHHRPRLYHAVEFGQPWRTTVPVVVTVHDLIPFLLPGYSWRSRLLRTPGLRLLPRADAVVVPSQATADDCIRLAGVEPHRIHVIPHGVSPRHRPPSEAGLAIVRQRFGLERPYLLGVGTFEPRKGLPHLVAAARQLLRGRDLDLVIAGKQGLFEPAVRAEMSSLGGHGRDLGFVDDDDLITLYGGAAAFVFPTRYEGFGLPLLEAMACGAPVVSFANSSLPEVAGDAAILVADGDEDALLRALERLLDDPAEADLRRAQGIAHAAGFTWPAAARMTLAVYESLLGEPLPRAARVTDRDR